MYRRRKERHVNHVDDQSSLINLNYFLLLNSYLFLSINTIILQLDPGVNDELLKTFKEMITSELKPQDMFHAP